MWARLMEMGEVVRGALMAFRLFQDLLVSWIAHNDLSASEDACMVFRGRICERLPFVGDQAVCSTHTT